MNAIRCEDREGQRWIRIEGDLDFVACEEINPVFRSAVRQAPATVVVDMSGVTHMASEGIAMLLRANKDLRDRGRAIFVSGLRRYVRGVFDRVGVLQAVGEWPAD